MHQLVVMLMIVKNVGHKNNSKEAITNFTVLERYKDMSLIECRLETGRTHQIRVHMSYIGYPVYGDPKYGKKKMIKVTDNSYMLKIRFYSSDNREYLEFECPLPDYFQAKLDELKGE